MASSECKFKRILVANRGEIAVRIIRSIKAYGAETHAIYSDVDSQALHIEIADKSHALKTSESKTSYLDIKKILVIAKKAKIDAIHPGYGFLSENVEFAMAVKKAGICLIGPAAEVMQLLGNKVNAKKLAKKLKIPLLESLSINHADLNNKEISTFIKKCGFPLVVKAAGGGGGRGMRIVRHIGELAAATQGAARESDASFGSSELFLERYIEKARHVEVQILADNYGNVTHIFDRDCSMQRNYQKVIEEAPAPNISAKTRKAIHAAAVKLCKAAKYQNAGTVEFLLTADERFYFLEVNSRLQVEHPVSEAISGLDLVKLQIQIAEGKKLKQILPKKISLKGHAIQCRICAESPDHNFIPSVGTIDSFDFQSTASGKLSDRLDSGVRESDSLSPYYDSMLAKYIVHRPDRTKAISAMTEALEQAQIFGVSTNINFLIELLKSKQFKQVSHYTKFIERFLKGKSWQEVYQIPTSLFFFSTLLATNSSGLKDTNDIWNAALSWRLHAHKTILEAGFLVNRHIELKVKIEITGTRSFTILSPHNATVLANVENFEHAQDRCTFCLNGKMQMLKLKKIQEKNWISGICGPFYVKAQPNVELTEQSSQSKSSPIIKSSLPGKITKIKVKKGIIVQKDADLIIIESMKMEHVLRAPCTAKIAELYVKEGDLINAGVELIRLDF